MIASFRVLRDNLRARRAPARKSDRAAGSARVRDLLARIHRDEDGGPSIETVLIIGAIALPILIFLIKFGWPRIKAYFEKGLDDLESGSDATIDPI